MADEWIVLLTEDGHPYYYNESKELTQWDKPAELCDAPAVAAPAPPTNGGGVLAAAASVSAAGRGNGSAAASPRVGASSSASASRSSVTEGSLHTDGTCVWELMHTASFGAGEGADAGEMYWRHKVTGETQWEQPDDYFDDDEDNGSPDDEVDAELEIDTCAPLEESFDKVGLLSPKADGERVDLQAGKASGRDACRKRLHNLLALFNSIGTYEEWLARVEKDDLLLPEVILSHFSEEANMDIRLLVCRLIVMTAQVVPSIYTKIGGQLWGPLTGVLSQIELGLQEIVEIPEKSLHNEAQLCWLMLLTGIFTECGDYGGIDEEHLPGRAYVERLFDIMADPQTDDVFTQAGKAVVAVNMHFGEASHIANPIMTICGTLRKAEHFGAVILHLINEQAFPYNDKGVLKHVLSCVRDLFECNKDTANFFFSNDLNVLVDIFIKEIKNLPPDDAMRCRYLDCLKALILYSPWMQSGRFRREDICKSLNNIMEAGQSGDAEMDAEAVQLVQDIYYTCRVHLE